MRQFFTIAIAAGTLAVTAFAFTATSSGLDFTQVGAASPAAPTVGHG
jgi:hypothetical protein